ncbi:MAG: prephenate dehydrogenase/arogenate dehydrogenase family protein [Victivallales bacterium]|nr:prephenate dehydrogenase/arogenate dehydrogenase family protein [Victivallales bacterium]
MKRIGIIGLGLSGGSLAKAAKRAGGYHVLGFDKQEATVLRAKMVEAIDGVLTPAKFKTCDILLLALYPQTTLDWLKQNAGRLGKGTLVVDCCGIKQEICELGNRLAEEHGFTFIGGHPMAGIERFGFAAAQPNLFYRASMILLPPIGTSIEDLARAKEFFLSLGFGRITIATPEEHDRVIAFTSQLPHIISSAYIKSPTAMRHTGMHAGSYRDMSRVATMQPDMWTELFLQNKTPLLAELDAFLHQLQQFRDALANNDHDSMRGLIDDGARVKAEVDKHEQEILKQK